jgi:hypothetical protein
MEIGIIGLPRAGKTTVFSALTRGKAPLASPAGAGSSPNVGVARVIDPRLSTLEAIFKPKKVIYPEIKYIDLAAPLGPSKAGGRSEGIRGQFLTHLSTVDAIMHVVRTFEEASVPHIEGSVDPKRDIAAMDMELAFSDMTIVERRLQRIETSLKGARAHEKDLLLQEKDLILRIKAELEKEVPLRDMTFTPEESRIMENYQFLTAKPLIVVLNIGENQVIRAPSMEEEVRLGHRGRKFQVFSICAKLEMELAQLAESEAKEFREALGLKESPIDRIVQLSYELLELLSFFTVVSGEARAWTIRRGTPAVKAAGKIHSDMEKGFIRAEVIAYEDLKKCGSMAEAKKRGLVRLEGKTYVVQDGDIITFLFNV